MTMQAQEPNKTPKHSKENIRITFNMAWPSIVESFFVAFAGLVDSLMVSSLGSYAGSSLHKYPQFIQRSLRILTHFVFRPFVRTIRRTLS